MGGVPIGSLLFKGMNDECFIIIILRIPLSQQAF